MLYRGGRGDGVDPLDLLSFALPAVVSGRRWKLVLLSSGQMAARSGRSCYSANRRHKQASVSLLEFRLRGRG